MVGVIYNIVAKHSGKCMTVVGNLPFDGTNIAQWSCDDSASQRFRLQAITPTTYVIVHPFSNKCVDVDNSGTTDGTNIQLYTCNNTGAQVYEITPSSRGDLQDRQSAERQMPRRRRGGDGRSRQCPALHVQRRRQPGLAVHRRDPRSLTAARRPLKGCGCISPPSPPHFVRGCRRREPRRGEN